MPILSCAHAPGNQDGYERADGCLDDVKLANDQVGKAREFGHDLSGDGAKRADDHEMHQSDETARTDDVGQHRADPSEQPAEHPDWGEGLQDVAHCRHAVALMRRIQRSGSRISSIVGRCHADSQTRFITAMPWLATT